MNIETTTLWLDTQNANIVRVLYISNTGWEKTMMADIDLHNEKVNLIMGKDIEIREPISQFQTSMYFQTGFRRLSFTGCNLSIINHAEEVIRKVIYENKDKAYDYINLLYHVEAAHYNYTYIDAEHMTVDEISDSIRDYVNTVLYDIGDYKDSFYCGITNDIDIRMQQHRDNDFNIVRNQVVAWLCCDVECAIEVEKRMGEFGYGIGRGNKAGNGANEDSRYVYILKKGKCTTDNVLSDGTDFIGC